MSKPFYVSFGSGDPRTNTGLSPTFLIFAANGVTALTPPGITETPAGSGFYSFEYGPTQSIVFLIDGGSALSSGDRYIKSALDPVQAVDDKIGYTTDSFGSTAADPGTAFGFLKRLQELLEGDKIYTKSTGIWQRYNRGSTTLLRQKTLTNTTTQATDT